MIIKNTYDITTRTLAIMPAQAIDHDTIILEKHNTCPVRQTPLTLVKHACINHGATYEGRRRAVAHHTQFKQKVPIPISIMNRLYVFPTHSPRHFDNAWIAYHNIHLIHYTQPDTSRNAQTIIQFNDGQTITLNVSKHIIQTQMKRTFQCILQLETMIKQSLHHTKPELVPLR